MQLNFRINYPWKLCTIGTIFCCLIILVFLNQNDKFASFSAATTNTMLQLAPLIESPAPLSSFIAEPPQPASSPPPTTGPGQPGSPLRPLPSLPEPRNFTSKTKEEQKPNATLTNHGAKPNFSVYKLQKPITMKSKNEKKCDVFDGRWVYKKEEKPSYDSSKCPFIEEKMNCRKNGRPDFEYEKWRWEANDCNIPLFDGKNMLNRLRNKRVIIVGDSLNRNMWESLSCLLYSSIPPSRAQVHAKFRDYKVLKAKDFNAIVEFHWSPFLVDFDTNHKSGKKVLNLDKLSSNSKQWRGADVMVFNSGHWWIHKGKFKSWDSFQYKGQLLEKMPIQLAYDRGMKTWAKWIRSNVDPKKTMVFFRSISANHNVGKHWCYNSTLPIMDESYQNPFPKLMVNNIERLIKEMSKSHVKYLNITKLSQYRNDAHPSVYRTSKWKLYTIYNKALPSNADCSHWCLPGLPDTWNRLLYTSLFYF